MLRLIAYKYVTVSVIYQTARHRFRHKCRFCTFHDGFEFISANDLQVSQSEYHCGKKREHDEKEQVQSKWDMRFSFSFALGIIFQFYTFLKP
ncbi:hypothetical protein SDC9_105495 [bioreactor metagenome]|uniref:Uncharacterized protein n=1 Tax=bioreactor metagenome TaxID=1076179 RepID=A0A645AZN9_9ZZZZ